MNQKQSGSLKTKLKGNVFLFALMALVLLGGCLSGQNLAGYSAMGMWLGFSSISIRFDYDDSVKISLAWRLIYGFFFATTLFASVFLSFLVPNGFVVIIAWLFGVWVGMIYRGIYPKIKPHKTTNL